MENKNDKNWYIPVPKKLLNSLVKAVVALSLPLLVYASIKHYKREGFAEQRELMKFVWSAPRKEYIVKKGDTIESIMQENFPIEEDEFAKANSVSPGLKWVTATNTYRDIIRIQQLKCPFGNPLEVGTTIRIPYRE